MSSGFKPMPVEASGVRVGVSQAPVSFVGPAEKTKPLDNPVKLD
jgi:hypothetical protein